METPGISGRGDLQIESEATARGEYNAMQMLFLLRLHRLVEKSREVHAGPAKEWQRTLVKKAIFSTFNDCIAFGLETEARRVLRGEN